MIKEYLKKFNARLDELLIIRAQIQSAKNNLLVLDRLYNKSLNNFLSGIDDIDPNKVHELEERFEKSSKDLITVYNNTKFWWMRKL